MAIIVDTNCFARVFCRTNKEHSEFAPVLDWIISGSGFLVYGGSKYKDELKKAKKYLSIFVLLKKARKAVVFEDKKIDELQFMYEKMITNPDFDDPHLPAIVRVSKCRLICSKDSRSIPFITSPELYPKRFHLPKYYSGLKDKYLLVDTNIDPRLKKNCGLLSKREKETFYKKLNN